MTSRFELSKRKSVLLLVIVAVLWSLGGLLIKLIDWHPLAIAGIRSIIAAIILKLAFSKTEFNVTLLEGSCAVAYSSTVILFILATKLTTAANAVLLQYTAPVYVAILGSWVLRERATLIDWVIISIMILGMALFFLGDLSHGMVLGNILAIFSGLAFAVSIVLLRKQKNKNPVTSIILGNIITFFVGLPFMFDYTLSIEGLINLTILGIFQLGISDTIYSIAIKNVTALEAIIITSLEPALNPLWVFLYINEIPSNFSLIGGLIIIVMIIIKSIKAVSENKMSSEITTNGDINKRVS